MRRLVLPLLLGGAVLLSPIASRSSAPEPTLREGLVLPLPGQLNSELMVNDNNPEVVSDSGILLSTFAAQGKAHPGAHLDVPLSGSFELFSHHVFAGKGQAPNSTLWLAVVVGNRSSQPVTVSIPSAASHLSQPDAPFCRCRRGWCMTAPASTPVLAVAPPVIFWPARRAQKACRNGSSSLQGKSMC